MKKSSTSISRYSIATIILKWLISSEFPDRLLEKVNADRAFVLEVVLGIIRNKTLLLECLKHFFKRDPSPAILAFLLTGAYQLLLMDTVEDYAAVHETVESSKEILQPKEVAFLNAVLRKLAQNKDKIKATFENMSPYVRFSHPETLYKRWVKNFGEDVALEICKWNNERAFMWVKPYMMKEEEIIEWLAKLKLERGLSLTKKDNINGFFPIAHGTMAKDIPLFSEGKIVIADPVVWNAIQALKPNPGELVLDACASPGGKTALIAEQMQCKGILVAMDIHKDRLKILEDNMKRLKLLPFVKIVRADAANVSFDEIKYVFDKILVDAPCSNTGVIRRKPDIRWRFDERKLEKLVATQWSILTNIANLLKVGGTLVYSTCSIEPEENDMLIEKWLSQHTNFNLLKKEVIIPSFKTKTDGAFFATLLKCSN